MLLWALSDTVHNETILKTRQTLIISVLEKIHHVWLVSLASELSLRSLFTRDHSLSLLFVVAVVWSVTASGRSMSATGDSIAACDLAEMLGELVICNAGVERLDGLVFFTIPYGRMNSPSRSGRELIEVCERVCVSVGE